MKKEIKQKQFDWFKVFEITYTETKPFDIDLLIDIKKELKKHIKFNIVHYDIDNMINRVVLSIYCDWDKYGVVSGCYIDKQYLTKKDL